MQTCLSKAALEPTNHQIRNVGLCLCRPVKNKKNLFVELNDNYFIVAIGEYDEELNFKIIDKEVFLPSGFLP